MGIMGDAKHQARESDHNSGRALDVGGPRDVMVDVAKAFEGHNYVKYIIFEHWIWHRPWQRTAAGYVRGGPRWDRYVKDDHFDHVHISFHRAAADKEITTS